MRPALLGLLAAGMLLLGAARPSSAIPAFARRTGLPCTSCHTVAPVLNRFGQHFLENGYRLARESGGAREQPPERKAEESVALPEALGLRLRATAIAEQPEETLEFDIPSFSLEVGLPFARKASFWTDFFFITGDENARPGDIILGINGVQWQWLDVRLGQLSPPLLVESQRRLLIDLPDVYARGSLVNGWFLARRRLGVGFQARTGRLQPGLYLFQEDTESDLDNGRPDWAATLDWEVSRFLLLQLYGYRGDVIVVPAGAAGFRDKFRQGTVSLDYLRGRWHLVGAYSTGRHENADGLGTRSTNEGFFAETRWLFRPSAAAIVRLDRADNPLLAPRRLTTVTFGLTRRVLDDRLRYLLEYRLGDGHDDDRIAVELEVNL